MGKKNATPKKIIDRVHYLREIINSADYEYYVLSKPTISDKEYNELYYELMLLERDYPNVRSDVSPTQRVCSDSIDGFEKSEHEYPMLSMDKIKADDFRKRTAVKQFILKTKNNFGYTGQWKCDGLTLVLTYERGKLVKAVTRGDGYVGDVVTVNAKTIRNIPLVINKNIDRLVVRGEAMISKKNFSEINSSMISNGLEPYANARNLASGSLKSLDPKVCSERKLMFFAYDVVLCEAPKLDLSFENIINDEFWLKFLEKQHFSVVPYVHVDNVSDFVRCVDDIEYDFDNLDYAIDGVVFKCNDYDVRKKLGNSRKYPNWAFAYKFDDDIYTTVLRDIEWDVSRTRRINPVAIFDPIVIDGTTVDRATLNNPDYIKELELGIGDSIGVIKANMIIPNIVENYSKSNSYKLPAHCPVCGGELKRKGSYLYCKNPKCYGANLRRFNHFCSKGAMDIRGLSNSKLFDLLENDIVSEFYHFYDGTLEKNKRKIIALDGWGTTSYKNLINAVEQSRAIELPRFIYGLGIPNIGYELSCVISEIIEYDINNLLDITYDDIIKYDGFGDKITKTLIKWIKSKRIQRIVNHFIDLYNSLEVVFVKDETNIETNILDGFVFCITGKLSKPRDYFVDSIIRNGGDYTSTIKKNTTHLLYGEDAGSKLEKAKEKGINLVSEDEYFGILKNEIDV